MDHQVEALANLLARDAEAYGRAIERITQALESIHTHIATLPEPEQAALQPCIAPIGTAVQRLSAGLDDLNNLCRDMERLLGDTTKGQRSR